MAHSGNIYLSIPSITSENEWKTPFALAAGLHFLVLILSLLPPSLFYKRPDLPEVITINLFNAEEPRPKKPITKKRQPPKTQPKKAEKTPPPPPSVKKPAQSIAQDPPPPTIAAPQKITSLAPRKIKKKSLTPAKKPKNKDIDDKRLKALDRIQARVNKRKEDQKLKHDLAKLRESLHVAPPEVAPPPEAETAHEAPMETGELSAKSTGYTELMDMALKRYYVAVSRRIHNNWVLPEMQDWDESLEALIVMIVRNDGTVIRSFFEKKSDNNYFNQFVEKTIKESSPLPQFPADMKKTKLEIGLRFHPSGLF